MKYIMKVTFCIKHKFFNNIYSIKSIEYTTNENAMILGKIHCNNIINSIGYNKIEWKKYQILKTYSDENSCICSIC
jgi:hypothetical protein